ncbi:MAG: arginine-tRNA-protein [Beijerinckiaceae bacterium]|nr:MAG: arginine-tRNA-protein [Beijerinckiaceae bacterium]
MTEHPRNTPQFFLTSPSTCPYLPERQERKVFTHLVGKRALQLNEILTQGGFRRSQSIAYRPACDGCRACVSVRVLVREFEPSRGFRRILAANADLAARMVSAQATAEHYSLFRRYLDARHAEGGMVDMSVLDYASMVEDSHVETRLVEYRRPPQAPDETAELVGVALTDVLSDGLSMVYSFYDPELAERSLGTYMILDHIAKAKAFGLPYLYLGYWVEGSRKMAYKGRFLPQERLGMLAWDRVEA